MKLHADPKPAPGLTMDLRMPLVEEKIRSLCAEPAQRDDIYQTALDGHLRAGGQRTRAHISLSCSTALNLNQTDSIALAASVELLHNASLVQDDLQDKATTRRGAATVWSEHGPDCAIGLTDLMIAAAFRALGEISQPRAIPGLIENLYRAISVTIRGQTDDLSGTAASLEGALSIARRKSGPLFALSLELPLYLGGRHESLGYALEAAEAFGLGYQIYDDIVDLDEDRAVNSHGNTVLALESSLPPEEARASARLLARQYLETSASMARELPLGSGRVLSDLSSRIGDRLNDLFDVFDVFDV
jgi:geranylgeranyl pyrophosphate synthase